MKGKNQLKGFILGILVSVLVFSVVSPALAALSSKRIDVYTGVDIYIDDKKLYPKDANGNPVEAFVYNGTTYLPVRAVGEAVGKTVQWEGKTNSVYLGKHKSDKPAVFLKDLDYFTGSEVETWNVKDNLGNTWNHAITDNYVYNTYLLNGQYSAISGTLFQEYDSRGITWYDDTLEIYGDGELLYTGIMTGGLMPLEFYVDLTGVLELTVYFNNGYRNAAIGDCSLWT